MQFIGGIDPAIDSPYPLSPITNFMNARGCTKTALRGSYHFNYIKAKKRWLEDLDAGYNDWYETPKKEIKKMNSSQTNDAISYALDNHKRYNHHGDTSTYAPQWIYSDKKMILYSQQVIKPTKELLADLVNYLGLGYYNDKLVKKSQAENLRIAIKENTKGKV